MGLEERSDLQSSKRIEKARKHLDRAIEYYGTDKGERSVDELESFLMKATSAFEFIEEDFGHIEGFYDWYGEHDEMIDSGEGFRKLRNHVVHDGNLRLGAMIGHDFGPDIDLNKGEIKFSYGQFFYLKKRGDEILDVIALKLEPEGDKFNLIPVQGESINGACFWPEGGDYEHTLQGDDAFLMAEDYISQLESLVEEAIEKFGNYRPE